MDFHASGITMGGLVAGVLCGLVPLGISVSKRCLVLGILGFFVCFACGMVGGLLLGAPVMFFLAIFLSNRRTRYRRY